MSEEMTKIFCSQCGAENAAGSKFCRSCGAKLEDLEVKVEEPAAAQTAATENTEAATEASNAGVFSNETVTPVYENITDAEVIPPVSNEEIKINYAAENSHSDTYNSQPQYHVEPAQNENQTNGNIGFAIASMICGILSLICCCLGLFSLLLGIVAIVLGIITIACKYDGKGMAIAGITTGGIGFAFWAVGLVLSKTAWYTELTNEFLRELY